MANGGMGRYEVWGLKERADERKKERCESGGRVELRLLGNEGGIEGH